MTLTVVIGSEAYKMVNIGGDEKRIISISDYLRLLSEIIIMRLRWPQRNNLKTRCDEWTGIQYYSRLFVVSFNNACINVYVYKVHSLAARKLHAAAPSKPATKGPARVLEL